MNLYVIGPVTGKENDNIDAFDSVYLDLVYSGAQTVTIPHMFIEPDDEWQYAMAKSIEMICDMFRSHKEDFGIAMLDGWEESKGAKIEHNLAVSLGIPCKPWREWL